MNRGSDSHSRPRFGHSNRFNEAPIHESGKCYRVDEAIRRPGRASMRPRFMNRGSLRRLIQATNPPSSFNEAPIHESGKW